MGANGDLSFAQLLSLVVWGKVRKTFFLVLE